MTLLLLPTSNDEVETDEDPDLMHTIEYNQ
jgi:hypothetical protein